MSNVTDVLNITDVLIYFPVKPSAAYEPMGRVYLALLILWAFIIVFWTFNWGMYARNNVVLQQMISLPIALRTTTCGLLWGYWDVCRDYVFTEDQGDSTTSSGSCPRRQFAWPIALFVLLSSCAMVGVLLLIAKGYTITRNKLRRGEGSAITWTSIAYSAVQAIGYAATVLDNRLVILLYILVIFVLYIAILRFIFVSIDLNLRVLKAQMFLIRQASIDPTTTPAMDKFMMFRNYQKFMAVYVFLGMFLTILRNFITLRVWVFVMLVEALDIALFAGICWVFRFRTWSPYFGDVPTRPAVSNSVPDRIRSRDLRQHDPSLVPWRFGQPLPTAPDTTPPPLVPSPRVVVVVQNPASLDARGQPMVNVAVGTKISLRDQEAEAAAARERMMRDKPPEADLISDSDVQSDPEDEEEMPRPVMTQTTVISGVTDVSTEETERERERRRERERESGRERAAVPALPALTPHLAPIPPPLNR